jgi:hypothetical protein
MEAERARDIAKPGDERYDFRMWTVDVAQWLSASFTAADHIVVKLDIEGSEFDIVHDLVQTHSLPLIDVLALECHANRSLSRTSARAKCVHFYDQIRHAAPKLKLLTEGVKAQANTPDHYGRFNWSSEEEWSGYSNAASLRTACSLINPNQFSLSIRHLDA